MTARIQSIGLVRLIFVDANLYNISDIFSIFLVFFKTYNGNEIAQKSGQNLFLISHHCFLQQSSYIYTNVVQHICLMPVIGTFQTENAILY